jgi:uncharacterized membrane protein YdbT with pleckstrin-like domain
VHVNYLNDQPPWLPGVAALLLLVPITRHARRQFTKIIVEKDKLRYETGLLSKSTRTIQLSKVQDIRVDQRLLQRLLETGDLSIETAGETSRLTIADIDSPQEVADSLMELPLNSKGKGQRA